VKRDFDRAFFVCGRKAPLLDGARSGFHQDGVSANDLNVLDCAVCTHEDAELYDSADSFIAKHSGILRFDPFQNLAVGILRENDARAQTKYQCQTRDLRQSAGNC